MSTRVFQNVINQLKDTIERTVAVIDETGTVIACTDLSRVGEKHPAVLDMFTSDDEVVVSDKNTYRLIGSIAKIDKYKFRSRYMGVVFQSFNLITKYTALENVILSMDVAGYKCKNKKQKNLR